MLVRDVVIQGATGMLGGALLAAASPPANSRAIKLANSRQIFAAMQSRQNLDLTGFTRSEHGKHLDWICASGLIDPTIEQLFENLLLLEGLHPNPAQMVPRIQDLLEQAVAASSSKAGK